MNSWRRVSNFGILRDNAADPEDSDSPWHSARLYDALRVGGVASGPLLAASPLSGLWLVSSSGGLAIPLSWEWGGLPPAQPTVWSGSVPNVVCLAQGFYTSEHVYAGGGNQFARVEQAALSETDVTKPAPLFQWRDIPIADANKQLLQPGAINRLVVVSQLRKIVLACDNGVFWAHIPPPGGTYIFQQAALPGQRFSGLAVAQGSNVIAGAWGTDLGLNAPAGLHAGIFVGTWVTPMGPLNFTPATIFGVNVKLMRRVDIASCVAAPNILYAVSGGGNPTTPQTNAAGNPLFDGFGNVTWTNDNDFILCVLRSQDGGQTWRPTGRTVVGDPLGRQLFPGNPASDVVGHTQNGYVGCIGVSPFDSRLVAVGMGLPVISEDSGASWTLFSDSTGPGNLHRHGDTHGLAFDPSDRTTLHVCSDGGLATTPDLGKTWHSGANRQLPDLEFYKTSPSPKDSGLVAGSLQDNGNVYAPLYINTDPWKTLDTGDGVMTQFVITGDLLRQNNTLTANDATTGLAVEYGRQVRAAIWDDAQRKFTDRLIFPLPPLSFGVIPVDSTGAGLSVPANEDGLELTEPVGAPLFKNEDGEPMVAVGASGLQIFGLFVQPNGSSHWEVLGSVIDDGTKRGPTGALLPPDFVSAVTSRDGTFIYCGTNNGNVFRLDAPTSGLVFSLTVIPASGSATILRIVAFAPNGAFLIAGATVVQLTIATGTVVWTTLTGKVLPSGLPALLPVGQQYSALAADPTTNPPTLYVATAFAVFVSQDNGDSWLSFSEGLPNAPLCTDLRWVQEASGVTFLYVSAQGWSVFRRALNVQEGAFSTLVVDGHMDLTDRVLLGTFTGDDTSFVWFNDSRVLGPFHPIDQMKFHGDETIGGEVSSDLKLDLLWKVDSSIDVKWHASMSTDEDSSQSDLVNVATGSSEDVPVDFKTDDIDPDRVHIEFTATN